MSGLTEAEIEQSSRTTCADHVEPPTVEMRKTHKQLLCGECLLWKIWVPKETGQ